MRVMYSKWSAGTMQRCDASTFSINYVDKSNFYRRPNGLPKMKDSKFLMESAERNRISGQSKHVKTGQVAIIISVEIHFGL